MNPQNQNLTGIVANPYNTQGLNTLNLGNQSSNLPPVPNTLNAGNVGNFRPLNAPSGTQPSNFLNELTANYQTNLNQLQTQQQNKTSSISDLLNSLTGQTSDKISAENQAGLPALSSQARDLQALSQRQLAAYAQNIFNNDTVGGQYRSSQTGNEAMITRQHGIDAMITNANISAISGQIQTAQAQVDRAMSLKYDPIKQQIENQKFLLEQVNTKEARAASNVKDFQLKQIDKQQADETTMQKMIIDATGYQAPAEVIQKAKDVISKGGTPQDVAVALGKYATDPLEREIKQLTKQKTIAEIGKLNSESSGKGSNKLLSVTEAQAAGVPFGTTEAQLIASGGQTVFDPKKAEQSIGNLDWLKQTAQKASDLSKGAGRTGIHEFIANTFTLSEKKQLHGLSDSLKTNILTMAADPNIKKFFGPQMSEADVRMMTAAGTTLNPDTQTPQQYKDEAARVYDMFNRAQKAVEEGLKQYQLSSYIDTSGQALQVVNSPFIK